MAKRKHQETTNGDRNGNPAPTKKAKPAASTATAEPTEQKALTIQVVAGSYDKVLHGVVATISPEGDKADFVDSFLFNAHTSAIRTLAISPPSAPVPGQGQKVMLASGAGDERINVYHLSAHPPRVKTDEEDFANVAPRPIRENSKNRELGTLLHHSAAVTALAFPTRGKLLSSSEDSTIGVTRTRDWCLLSTIKAPKPKVQGQASGDAVALGMTSCGVNDFAIHPSMKLMISLSRRERCMRLWNLVTGKKAGVLNFSKNLLMDMGEGQHSTGEGRRVMWGGTKEAEAFAVMFDRNIAVFGMDSTPRCKVFPGSRQTIHQARYIPTDEDSGESTLAVSTGDGRIVFFSTAEEDLVKPEEGKGTLSMAKQIGQLGGKDTGSGTRLKDFVVLESGEGDAKKLFFVTGSSDGCIRIWKTGINDIRPSPSGLEKKKEKEPQQIAKLLGKYETQNRVTCVAGFIMTPRPFGVDESETEWEEDDDEDSSSSESEDADDEK